MMGSLFFVVLGFFCPTSADIVAVQIVHSMIRSYYVLGAVLRAIDSMMSKMSTVFASGFYICK